MSRPSIVEVDDDDIDNMDFDLPDVTPALARSSAAKPASAPFNPANFNPAAMDEAQMQEYLAMREKQQREFKELTKNWTCLYPIYIDATRSKSHGRRIPKPLSHPAPTAIYMAEACRTLGFPTVLEGQTRHPADPLVFGRVRVQLRDPTTKQPTHPTIRTRLQLLVAVAKILDGCEMRLRQEDPNVAVMAAASRSTISKEVQDLAKAAVKEKEERESGVMAGGKKKGKKKK
ncbi:signal recognition particle subunit [Rhizophlyctis rosea]|nr:signal recognition particle subunit [Rhizophlyctis rosea]